MNRSKVFFIITFILLSLSAFPQSQAVFTWSVNRIVLNDFFVDGKDNLYKVDSMHCNSKKIYKETYQNVNYQIEMKSSDNFEADNDYEILSIKNLETGKTILECVGYYGFLTASIEYLTAGQSKAPYLKLPLDDNSFALFFAGLVYTGSDAPEMMIVVVNKNSASVVFDKMACVYKYTPYPKFSIEYVEDIDWMMTLGGYMPPASVFNKLKRFKIWQEGNILKYKPLN